MSTQAPSPWYREPWTWFLLGILAFSIGAGLFLAVVATRGADSLVQDNYYKDGLAINQNLSRDRRARSLELAAEVQIDPVIGELRLSLSGQLQQQPEQLLLRLLSPTRAHHDLELVLQRTPANDYLGQLPEALQGRRYVQLETLDRPDTLTELNGRDQLPGWRISTQLVFDQRVRYHLEPALD